MKHLVALVIAVSALIAHPAEAQEHGPPGPEALRQMTFGMALGRIGQSGLRRLFSASGNLGDLQNRAGSYRTAFQMERTRTAFLQGRIDGLGGALQNPNLPPSERLAIERQQAEAMEELGNIPTYEALYSALTIQGEALKPLTLLRDAPVFLLVRARGHARWGGEDELGVWSEALSAGPLFVFSSRWIVAPSLLVGRTDVNIGAFDGSSGSTSLGPRLDLGVILDDRWSAALQVAYAWTWNEGTIERPGPNGSTTVQTESTQQAISLKAEMTGSFDLVPSRPGSVSISPQAGFYLQATEYDPATNSLGERETGSFGRHEHLAAFRLGAGIEKSLGAWSPQVYFGWEHEFTSEMSELIRDRNGILATAGISYSWARSRRVLLDLAVLRGTEGLRGVSEITFVVMLDG